MRNKADFHTSSYVFVHGSAGAGAQWRDIAALLAPSAPCVCPDLVGYGSGPAFDRGSYRFQQEIAIIEQALETAGSSSVLVGHSFGGVVALAAAIARPELAARLVLIEPVAFTLLDSASDITRRLSVPTLVLRGSASPRLEREVCAVVAGASPCCTLSELPAADHMSPLLRAQEVLAAIRDFSARPHAATIPTAVI
jgi:pimeloyl-ACP methyl ester carboxylesterase